MTNLELVFPEIFLSLSIMFLLILGVFKKDSSKLIQNSSLIVFYGCAHNVHLEKIKKFNRTVLDFINNE